MGIAVLRYRQGRFDPRLLGQFQKANFGLDHFTFHTCHHLDPYRDGPQALRYLMVFAHVGLHRNSDQMSDHVYTFTVYARQYLTHYAHRSFFMSMKVGFFDIFY
jgi:hypothetical protein